MNPPGMHTAQHRSAGFQSQRHDKFLFPAHAKAIYGNFCKAESEISNVVDYRDSSRAIIPLLILKPEYYLYADIKYNMHIIPIPPQTAQKLLGCVFCGLRAS